MSRRKPEEPSQHHKYQSALDIARFIADAVGYKIAIDTSKLAAHQRDPVERRMTALKRLARYLKRNPDLGVQYARKNTPTSKHSSPLHLVARNDSNWASYLDIRLSRTGFAFTLSIDLILWPARR